MVGKKFPQWCCDWDIKQWERMNRDLDAHVFPTYIQCSLLGYQTKYVKFKEITAQLQSSQRLGGMLLFPTSHYSSLRRATDQAFLFQYGIEQNSMFCINKKSKMAHGTSFLEWSIRLMIQDTNTHCQTDTHYFPDLPVLKMLKYPWSDKVHRTLHSLWLF